MLGQGVSEPGAPARPDEAEPVQEGRHPTMTTPRCHPAVALPIVGEQSHGDAFVVRERDAGEHSPGSQAVV